MIYPCTLAAPNEVSFDGIVYRLMGARRYYLSQSRRNEGRKGAKGLHVAIWEASNREPMPKGWHCHHKDGNPFNNAPENLEAIEPAKHHAHHPFKMTEEQRLHLDRVRDLTKAWHASEEGLAWHRQHGKATWENREYRVVPCAQCGKAMRTRSTQRRYCNSYCNYLALKAAGELNRSIVCAWCGEPAVVQASANYRWPVTCGRSCARKLGAARRGAA